MQESIFFAGRSYVRLLVELKKAGNSYYFTSFF